MGTEVIQPTEPAVESISTRVMEGELIRPGQPVFLSCQGDDQTYLATVYGGVAYWYPTCGPNRVKVVLRFDCEALRAEDSVKIVTTERSVGSSNTLGAFTLDPNCYYFKDDQGDKQLWQVTPLNRRPDGTVRFGDRVFLTNRSFSTQRLTRDGKYLKTAEVDTFWVIEKD
jgi:hypothetical protein